MSKEVTRTLFAISRTIYLGLGSAFIGIGLFALLRSQSGSAGAILAIVLGVLGLVGTILQPHRLVLAAALRALANLGLCLVAGRAFLQDVDYWSLPLYAPAPTLLVVAAADFLQKRRDAARSVKPES